MAEKKKQWIIKLDDSGFFGDVPFTPVSRKDATVMTNKNARGNLSRLRDRFRYTKAEIVPA